MLGEWGLGIGDWGLGPIPNPQSPIPNPQSPIPMTLTFTVFICHLCLDSMILIEKYNKYY